jgi:hypothetical protein
LSSGLLRVSLVRFVATNDTTSGSTDFTVSRDRPGDASNDGTLDASLGVGRRRERKSQNGGANEKPFHGFSPE